VVSSEPVASVMSEKTRSQHSDLSTLLLIISFALFKEERF
jgi:hypothetical protein